MLTHSILIEYGNGSGGEITGWLLSSASREMEVIAVGRRIVAWNSRHLVADVGWAAPRHGAAGPGTTEVTQEESLELVTENAVDDEVDGRVEADEQVADARHLVHENVGRFEDVDHHGQDVEDEEDGDDTQQHRRQPNLALLWIGQHRSLPIGLPYLKIVVFQKSRVNVDWSPPPSSSQGQESSEQRSADTPIAC